MATHLAVPAPHLVETEGLIARPTAVVKARYRRPDHHRSDGVDEPPVLRQTLSTLGRSLTDVHLSGYATGKFTEDLTGGFTRQGSFGAGYTGSVFDQQLGETGAASQFGASTMRRLGARRPHPQTFKELLRYSRPQQFPWHECETEEIDDATPPRKSVAQSASAPALGIGSDFDTRRKSGRAAFDGDPESLLSPFALQARKIGADVVITGQRLRPSSGALFACRLTQAQAMGDAWQAEVDDEQATEHDQDVSSVRASSSSGARRRRQAKPKEPFRVPGRGARTASHKSSPSRSSSKGAVLAPPAKPARERPRERGSPREPGAARGRGSSPESTKKLAAAPSELWDGRSKLSAVKGLYDFYAADPLGAAPAAAGRRPSSSASFLEKYVERQAEIERMLQEQGKPPLVAPPALCMAGKVQEWQAAAPSGQAEVLDVEAAREEVEPPTNEEPAPDVEDDETEVTWALTS